MKTKRLVLFLAGFVTFSSAAQPAEADIVKAIDEFEVYATSVAITEPSTYAAPSRGARARGGFLAPAPPSLNFAAWR